MTQQLVLHHAWARLVYQPHPEQGGYQQVVLRIVAHHAFRVLFAIWRDGRPYDAAAFETARRQRQQHKAP